MIRVLLADDQALVRSGFRMILDATEDITVVGEASNGADAVTLAASTQADVVLMDVRMPGVDGLEATRRIAEDDDLAGVRVLILTTYEADDYVYQALCAGAAGFLVKDTEPGDLLQAIRVVAAGDALLSPRITRRLIADIANRPHLDPTQYGLEHITDREQEILTLVGSGLSNEDMAARLYLSPLTIKTHISRIMTKLNAHDRAQLVIAAYETGLVTPGQP